MSMVGPAGYVYGLEFPEKNIAKVGETVRDPKKRWMDADILEAVRQYGPFEVIFMRKVNDRTIGERVLRNALKCNGLTRLPGRIDYYYYETQEQCDSAILDAEQDLLNWIRKNRHLKVEKTENEEKSHPTPKKSTLGTVFLGFEKDGRFRWGASQKPHKDFHIYDCIELTVSNLDAEAILKPLYKSLGYPLNRRSYSGDSKKLHALSLEALKDVMV